MSTENLDKKKELGGILKMNREKMDLTIGQLALATKIQKKYITRVEKGDVRIRRGSVLRIAEQLILSKQERVILLAIIELFCSVNPFEKMGVHRNFSKRKRKSFPRKRSGVPVDVRTMKVVCNRISSRR